MKFIEFVKKHLFFVIALAIILLVLIIGIVVAKNLFFSSKGTEFGNRLDGIEDHPITEENLSKIKNELEAIENVIEINDNLVGRRLNFIIEVTTETDLVTSKSYGDKILENLSDDIKSYYDIQVMITNEDSENQNYPIIGYKHKTKVGFTW